jgi:hypothetical protein
MELFEQIMAAYPEIKDTDCFPKLGIYLQDDSDGLGAFIAKWEYSKPLTNGFTVGKPVNAN